jgi:hypothetical protein
VKIGRKQGALRQGLRAQQHPITKRAAVTTTERWLHTTYSASTGTGGGGGGAAAAPAAPTTAAAAAGSAAWYQLQQAPLRLPLPADAAGAAARLGAGCRRCRQLPPACHAGRLCCRPCAPVAPCTQLLCLRWESRTQLPLLIPGSHPLHLLFASQTQQQCRLKTQQQCTNNITAAPSTANKGERLLAVPASVTVGRQLAVTVTACNVTAASC